MIDYSIRGIIELPSELRRLIEALKKHGQTARETCNKSTISQIWEIINLRYSIGKLDPAEYYKYSLYEDSRFDWNAKKEFFGDRMVQHLVTALNSGRWSITAIDKLITHALLAQFGFPTPEIYGILHSIRSFGAVPCVRNREELRAFLYDGVNYPFVSKPITGIYSHNVMVVNSLDKDADTLRLSSREEISVEKFVSDLIDVAGQGYLFQQLMYPHPEIRTQCGDKLCTVRLLVNLHDDGPRIFRSLWKVATGTNMADNYWRAGNLLGIIDAESGRSDYFVRGSGSNREQVTTHPDTGKVLSGFVIPYWSEAVEMCQRAATCFSGLRMQAWDMAICPTGPIPLEVNIVGGVDLSQQAHGAGIYDDELRDFLRKFSVG